MKKWWIILALIILVPIAYYLISPLWNTIEVNDPLPITDSLETMDQATREEFEEEVANSNQEIKEMNEPMASTNILQEGVFKARAHDVQGTAKLIQDKDKTILRFEDFETVNGPNLHIYLSSGLNKNDFIDLGPIKGTKGNINYEITENIDFNKYNKVLVWCVPFSVLFSYAELQ